MNRAWLAVALLMLTLSGCAPEPAPASEPPAAAPLQPVADPDPGYPKVAFDTTVRWPSGDIVKAETPQQYYADGKVYWTVFVLISPAAPAVASDFFVEMYGATAMFEPVSLPEVAVDADTPVRPGEVYSARYAFVPTAETSLPSSVVLSGVGTQRPYTAFTGQVR